MDNHLLEFYRNLEGDNLSFIYRGHFSDAITDKLIDLSEINIRSSKEVRKLRKKVSFIMVESFQNIVRHGSSSSNDEVSGDFPSTFLLRNHGNAFYITSVNTIGSHKVADLKKKLDKVNALSPEELKALFTQVLVADEFSEKGGAGLGLIEMVRKSGEPIDYDFVSINNEQSSCFMRFKLKRKDDVESGFTPFSVDKEMHQRFVNQEVLMLYKGSFSQESVVPVLHMMEENMKVLIDELAMQKKTFNILVEVLQNISRHGAINAKGRKIGLFMISESYTGFKVSAGNLIDNEEVPLLKKKLSNLATLKAEELNDLYKKSLRSNQGNDGGAGLGLIDIYRDSNNQVEADFNPISDTQSFFSISITL